MRLRVSLGILLLFCKSVPGLAQLETAGPNPEPTPAKKLSESENSGYRSHPVWSDMLRLWSQDYLAFSKNLMGYSWQSYAGVGAATLSLLPFDQKIRDEAKDLGRRNNLLREDTQERRAFKFKLLGTPQGVFVPRGVMGYIWYLGDGSTWLLSSAAFASYGYTHDSYRSTQTAFQIIESLAITGPTVLAIKLATGRESPGESGAAGGRWHGFPGFKKYASNQARYYSFPSGHVAAAMSSLVVISENFPEEQWLLPFQCTTVGLLMFALMNVGSHWPSDYPLALGLAYTSAKTVVNQTKARHRQEIASRAEQSLGWSWEGLHPTQFEGIAGLESSWTF